MSSKFKEKEKQLSKVHRIIINEFENSLTSSMIVYIEKNIAISFSSCSIIKDFKSLKNAEEHFD